MSGALLGGFVKAGSGWLGSASSIPNLPQTANHLFVYDAFDDASVSAPGGSNPTWESDTIIYPNAVAISAGTTRHNQVANWMDYSEDTTGAHVESSVSPEISQQGQWVIAARFFVPGTVPDAGGRASALCMAETSASPANRYVFLGQLSTGPRTVGAYHRNGPDIESIDSGLTVNIGDEVVIVFEVTASNARRVKGWNLTTGEVGTWQSSSAAFDLENYDAWMIGRQQERVTGDFFLMAPVVSAVGINGTLTAQEHTQLANWMQYGDSGEGFMKDGFGRLIYDGNGRVIPLGT